MSKDVNVRWGWLKGMYIYTIIGAGGFGLGIIFVPNEIGTMFRMMNMPMPSQDPIVLGISGSVYLSFALLSILGLRSPLKFSPVMLLQLCYKVVWFMGVILPMLFAGEFPTYAIFFVVVFATYIIGDLIAIPFSYLFAKQSER